MNLFVLLAIVGIGSIVFNAVMNILIRDELGRRNIETDIRLIEWKMHKYIDQYKKATIEETGKPGIYYYLWLISIYLMVAVFLMTTYLIY